MIPLLNQQLFMGLAHAAQNPDPFFLHPKYQPVTHLSDKNVKRIHALRQHKILKKKIDVTQHVSKQAKEHLKSIHHLTNVLKDTAQQEDKTRTLQQINSIAQQISLARDVAHELYTAKEITKKDWHVTKELLKNFSIEILKKKEKLN